MIGTVVALCDKMSIPFGLSDFTVGSIPFVDVSDFTVGLIPFRLIRLTSRRWSIMWNPVVTVAFGG